MATRYYIESQTDCGICKGTGLIDGKECKTCRGIGYTAGRQEVEMVQAGGTEAGKPIIVPVDPPLINPLLRK